MSLTCWDWVLQWVESDILPSIRVRLSFREWMHVLVVQYRKPVEVVGDSMGVRTPASNWVVAREHSNRVHASF